MEGLAIWCDSCRRWVLGAWELGDGTRYCLACIRESIAVAQSQEANRALREVPAHAATHPRPVYGCAECSE